MYNIRMQSIKIFNYRIFQPIIWILVAAVFVSIAGLVAVDPASAYTARLLYVGNGYSAGKDLSRPMDIFYDGAKDEVYVADTGNHQIVVYDKSGLPVYRFFHHVTIGGKKQLGEPKSIAVDPDGRIFITDATVPYLDVLDHNGRLIASIDPPKDDCGDINRFDNVTAGSDGRIYATVTCAETRVVAVIGRDLDVQKILKLEQIVTSESCLTNINVDDNGRIYLTDPCAELMVRIYSPDGEFVWGFGRHDAGFQNFSHPTDIVIMKNGEMWIVDTIRQVASCFTKEGDFVSYVGGKGDHPGAFSYPVGLATDGENRLFVVERAGNRFQCFRIESDDPETASK